MTLRTDQTPGRTVRLGAEEWLYFSGTSYLGLSQNTDFQGLIFDGIRRYGANFGGSRRSNLQFPVFEQAEDYLAKWLSAEAALTLSSGTLAGQLAVKALQNSGKFYFAPDVHPALFGEGDYADASFEQWAGYILEEAQRGEPMVLFANALDPLRARQPDFSWLLELRRDTSVTLVLDDSHGLGITGREGAGVLSTLFVPENVTLIVVASLGKALSLPGGVIAGSQNFVQHIWQSPHFGGASPLPPAYLDAFLNARHLYWRAREILFANVASFQTATQAFGLFRSLDQYPVFYTPQSELTDFLQQYKVLISSFPYPSPYDERITRVVLNAAHTAEDLQRLIDFLKRFLNLIQNEKS